MCGGEKYSCFLMVCCVPLYQYMETSRPTIIGFCRNADKTEHFTATQETIRAELTKALHTVGLNGEAEPLVEELLTQPDYASGIRHEDNGNVKVYLSHYNQLVFDRMEQARTGEMWRNSH